jgi:hypothetical protein
MQGRLSYLVRRSQSSSDNAWHVNEYSTFDLEGDDMMIERYPGVPMYALLSWDHFNLLLYPSRPQRKMALPLLRMLHKHSIL